MGAVVSSTPPKTKQSARRRAGDVDTLRFQARLADSHDREISDAGEGVASKACLAANGPLDPGSEFEGIGERSGRRNSSVVMRSSRNGDSTPKTVHRSTAPAVVITLKPNSKRPS